MLPAPRKDIILIGAAKNFKLLVDTRKEEVEAFCETRHAKPAPLFVLRATECTMCKLEAAFRHSMSSHGGDCPIACDTLKHEM